MGLINVFLQLCSYFKPQMLKCTELELQSDVHYNCCHNRSTATVLPRYYSWRCVLFASQRIDRGISISSLMSSRSGGLLQFDLHFCTRPLKFTESVWQNAVAQFLQFSTAALQKHQQNPLMVYITVTPLKIPGLSETTNKHTSVRYEAEDIVLNIC